MKYANMFLTAVLPVLVLVIELQCANILGVFPLPLKSHDIMYQSVMMELARRGHNVTVINPFPKNQPPANFTDIDITECWPKNSELFSLDEAYIFHNTFAQTRLLLEIGDEDNSYIRMLFECKPMKQFLSTNDSYDLIITELFSNDVILGFLHKFKSPHVAFCPSPIYLWGADRTGNPSNPSYVPYAHIDEEFDRFHPTFYQRLYNTICYLYAKLYFHYYSYKRENLARMTFGSDMPSLDKIAKNTSLILTFSHFSFNAPMALVPGIVEVAGVQITEAKPLPENIRKFIDESEHGVVYFCMGSLLTIETMPEAKRIAFLDAFSQLPQRVIWRWGGNLPGKTDRMFTSEWMPQRDLFAHPKVKLFISHGGALGLNEAIYEGVPVLGIPMYADQTLNLRSLKAQGAAEILHYPDINNDTVLAKIKQVLQPEYSRNMKKVSQIFKDRPMSPMDTAIYWIEYVIRHKGARHLRTAAVDMPLYQYLLLDVIFFLFAVVLSVMFVVYYFFKKILSLLVRKTKTDGSKKKN